MTAILHDPAADTRALVDAAKAGDRDAFGQLYARYRPVVWRYIHGRIHNWQTAEDLTHDVFRKAMTAIARFEHQGTKDIGAWFTTISRNLLADYCKSGFYRVMRTMDALDYAEVADDDLHVDPLVRVLSGAASSVLLGAVARLNDEQRACIELRFLRGMTVAETAAALGKNEGAVKALQYRAVRALQRDPAVEALR